MFDLFYNLPVNYKLNSSNEVIKMEFKKIEISKWRVEVVYLVDSCTMSIVDIIPSSTAEIAQATVLRKHGIQWYSVVSIATVKA